ncbi:MAG: hypothetical protein WA977_02185 [Halobacteriota archaeon]
MKEKEGKSSESVTAPLAWLHRGAKEGSGGKLVVEKTKRGKPRFNQSEMRGGLPFKLFSKKFEKGTVVSASAPRRGAIKIPKKIRR